MNKDVHTQVKAIRVKVDTSAEAPNGEQLRPLSNGVIYVDQYGAMCLEFESGSVLHCTRIDEDGCPVFGWFGREFPKYAIFYPDGGEDWTVQSILDELAGVPVEESEEEPVEITFTFVSESQVGEISHTDIISVTQVIQR
nr:MAG TPA: hypothetical protein [Caudoviricetes sp.]